MGLTSRLVLFSEVHGTVTRNGAPVMGAVVTQEVVWSDDKNEIPPAQATTNSSGEFALPVVEKSAGVLRLVPHQPVILQKLLIRFGGVDYTGWRHTKDSYEANSELDGKPLRLVCELSTEPDFEGRHFGICREA